MHGIELGVPFQIGVCVIEDQRTLLGLLIYADLVLIHYF